MKVWKVILATLVIFCAGVFAGVQTARMCRTNSHKESNESPAPRPQGHFGNGTNFFHGTNREGRLMMPFGFRPTKGMAKEFLERVDRELKLEPAQRKEIDKILDESQKRTRETWKKFEPEMREEMKRTRDEIRKVLTSEQSTRFEELMKKPKKEGQPTNGVPPPPAGEIPPVPPTNPPAQ